MMRNSRIPWLYQVVLEDRRDEVQDGVRWVRAAKFLSALF